MSSSPYRAVLLDVDGTLYRQGPLRCFMALELSLLPLTLRSWSKAQKTVAILRKFRRNREELRTGVLSQEQVLDYLQYEETAAQVGVSTGEVKSVVTDWIYHRPLKYLPLCRRGKVREFLDCVADQGLHIGVFSDYPVREKIEALGLSKWVKLALCATDKEVNAFKPHPRGFLRACELWGLSPGEVLYIGDRMEVDGAGATAAGMPCIILDGTVNAFSSTQLENGPIRVTSFQGIQHALTTHC